MCEFVDAKITSAGFYFGGEVPDPEVKRLIEREMLICHGTKFFQRPS